MAKSYSYLMKQAGHWLPAPKPRRPYRTSAERIAREKEWLRAELDRLVAEGVFTRDDQGRYGLPEWKD